MAARFLLFHGLLGARRNWTSVRRDLPLLCTSPPLRCHEGSEEGQGGFSLKTISDDIQRRISRELVPVHLVASSLAGKAVMRHLVASPNEISDNLRSVTIVDAVPGPRPKSAPNIGKQLDALLALPMGESLTHHEARQMLKDQIPSLATRNMLLQSIDFRVKAMPRFVVNIKQIRDNLEAAFKWDLPPDAVYNAETGPPVSFIFGQNSPFRLDYVAQDSVARVFPTSKQVTIPKCGHHVHIEQKSHFVRAVKQLCLNNQINV